MAGPIRDLTAASKGHWAYPPARVREWADRLDLSAARIAAGELYVAEIDGRVVGWVEILPPDGGVCVLDHLWIEPGWMGRELGTRLFRHAVARARELGAHRLEWEAEPNATGFYERMGGRRVGTTIGSWGRTLPVMGLEISEPWDHQYSWTSGYPWFDAYCISVVSGLDIEEVLDAFAADRSTCEVVRFEEQYGMAMPDGFGNDAVQIDTLGQAVVCVESKLLYESAGALPEEAGLPFGHPGHPAAAGFVLLERLTSIRLTKSWVLDQPHPCYQRDPEA